MCISVINVKKQTRKRNKNENQTKKKTENSHKKIAKIQKKTQEHKT